MKKRIYISTAIVLVFGFIILPIFVIKQFDFNPSPPKIKYGEFPFRLKFEINGQQKVIEDVVICNFDGYEWRGESGKYRKWKSYLKSGNERITLIEFSENIQDKWNHQILELYFYWGNAEYYMSDLSNRPKSGQDFDYINYMYKNAEGKIGFSAFTADEAWNKYKVKLLSWEIAPPIKNTFK